MLEFAAYTNKQMTYAEAILYCQFLEHNGHTDWRMPVFDDLSDVTTHLNTGSKYYGWIEDDDLINDDVQLSILPVRDIC